MNSFWPQKQQINCTCFNVVTKNDRKIFRSQSYYSTVDGKKQSKQYSVKYQSDQNKSKKKSLKKQKNNSPVPSQKYIKQKQENNQVIISQIPTNINNQSKKIQKNIVFDYPQSQKLQCPKSQRVKQNLSYRLGRGSSHITLQPMNFEGQKVFQISKNRSSLYFEQILSKQINKQSNRIMYYKQPLEQNHIKQQQNNNNTYGYMNNPNDMSTSSTIHNNNHQNINKNNQNNNKNNKNNNNQNNNNQNNHNQNNNNQNNHNQNNHNQNNNNQNNNNQNINKNTQNNQQNINKNTQININSLNLHTINRNQQTNQQLNINKQLKQTRQITISSNRLRLQNLNLNNNNNSNNNNININQYNNITINQNSKDYDKKLGTQTPTKSLTCMNSVMTAKQRQLSNAKKTKMQARQIQSQDDGSQVSSDQISQVVGRGWDGLTEQQLQIQQLDKLNQRQTYNAETMITHQSNIRTSQIKTFTDYSNSFISPKSQKHNTALPFGGGFHKYGMTGLSYQNIEDLGRKKGSHPKINFQGGY